MLMAVLGGNDVGGGAIWAPKVLNDAKQHGLILSEKGKFMILRLVKNYLIMKRNAYFNKRGIVQFPK